MQFFQFFLLNSIRRESGAMLLKVLVFWGIGLFVLALAGCNRESNSSEESLSFKKQVVQARKESDPEIRARQLIKIGYQQGKAQDLVGAEETLKLAWNDCESIADAEGRAGALALMADAHFKLGNREAAQKAIAASAAAADKIEQSESKVRSLARLA
jgi:hypothetical protein